MRLREQQLASISGIGTCTRARIGGRLRVVLSILRIRTGTSIISFCTTTAVTSWKIGNNFIVLVLITGATTHGTAVFDMIFRSHCLSTRAVLLVSYTCCIVMDHLHEPKAQLRV